MISVTTRSFDNARSGSNLQEATLTAGAVGTRGIRRLFTLELPGDARGCEAQPLIAAGVTCVDKAVHNVLFVATMANVLFGFDADTGERLWTRKLANPITGSQAIDSWKINDHWGVLSTPVLDIDNQIAYVCAWQSEDGSVGKALHYLYAVSIADGADVAAPLNLEGATYPVPGTQTVLTFSSAARKQRTSLLLTEIQGRQSVLIAFGSLTETAASSRGWVIAVDTETMTVGSAWASTAKGSGGGLWQAGGGLASDDEGGIFGITGNGDFDGVNDLGECFVRLEYVPAAPHVVSSLSHTDWWSPFSDKLRTASMDMADDDDTPRASNHRPLHAAVRALIHQGCAPEHVGAAMNMAAWGDMDLGSAAPTLVKSLGLLLGCGKDGVLFAVKVGDMGKTMPDDLIQENAQANYAKLAFSPVFFTFYAPPPLSPHPDDIQTLNVLYANRSHHLHGAPVHYASPDHGDMLFCWGENGNLRAWSVTADSVTYLACGNEVASANSPVPPGGMPGGMIHVSADGSEKGTGVVWATIPYGDANTEITNGRLLAYDAQTFDENPDGSKRLRVLWDSQDWDLAFVFNKFGKPVPANGKVYVPTYAGTIDVYGLA